MGMFLGFLFGNRDGRLQKSAEKYGNVLKNKVTTKNNDCSNNKRKLMLKRKSLD
jgi:hypothetical protein